MGLLEIRKIYVILFHTMIILILLVILTLTCFVLLFDLLLNILTVVFFKGAFYTRSSNKRLQALQHLLHLSPNDKVVDLGSGKGQVVAMIARNGAKATGIEVNPWLVFISNWHLRRHGLNKQVKIIHSNFWTHDLSKYTVVIVYGIGYMMKHLKLKLERELKPGTKVASVYFPIPGWKTVATEDDVRLYVVPDKG